MKRIKKIILALLAILVVVQVPFIYRRYLIGNRAEKVAQIQSQRKPKTDPNYVEYKGNIHVHTSLGGHSTGGFDELIAAANANDLDFVVMTEHYSESYDTAAMTLNGIYGKTLFLGGNEIDTADSDRFFMLPGGADAAGFRFEHTGGVLSKIHSEKGLAVIAYPEKFKTWDSAFDGIEVFNLKTMAKRANPLTLIFDALWSGYSYPALMFADHLKRPDVNLQQFDEISKARRISMFGGTDGHSNIGIHLFGTETGGKLLNIKIDPYDVTFRIVRMHILLPKDVALNRESLIEAIRQGNYFTGFDAFGDTTGFSFVATSGVETTQQGGEVVFSEGLSLKASSPVTARTVILKNGEKFGEQAETDEFSVKPDGPGVYRVEIYQDALGETGSMMPWIVSNPIYVR